MAMDVEPDFEEQTGDDESSDVGLSDTQVQALERLDEMGKDMPEWDEANEKWLYDSDPKTRALQLVAQGRLGGPGRGQGRKSEKDRVAARLSARMARKVDKMEKVLDKALDDENLKIGMEAVRTVVDLEDRAIKQRISEERHEADLDTLDRGDLVGEILSLVADPLVSASLGAAQEGRPQAALTLPAGAVEELDDLDDNRGDDSAGPSRPRNRIARATRSSRGGSSAGSGRKAENPWATAARRRSAN